MLVVKVLGIGCENCHRVEEAAREAVSFMGLEAEIIKLTDRADWKPYALLATPGLVINEKLVCAGRIPSTAEVSTWLADAAMAA
jgi:small redox-active disulfide protein 2